MRIKLQLLAVIFLALVAARTAFSQEEKALMKQANIVITGTVVKLGASSFAEAPATPQTMVVRVDAVLKKPRAVSLKRGDTVTIEAKEPSELQQNATATFYTEGWIFGSGIALREIGHVPAREGETATSAFNQMQEEVRKQDLQDRLNAADAVVTGRVVAIKPAAVQALNAGGRVPISEHSDPQWQDAVVEVAAALKGTDSKQIVVRFPASRDVRWVNYPKFQKGQTAIFVLKTDQLTGSPRALLFGAEVPAYTAITPADVLPVGAAQQVRALLHR
jgi:hypothetical protein